MHFRLNDKGLIYLDKTILNAIFDCVFDIHDGLQPGTLKLLADQQFGEFMKLLKTFQDYNYHYRFEQTSELFPLFDSTVGPMERNSEGTILWLALGLAIKELYGMRKDTFKGLLANLEIKK